MSKIKFTSLNEAICNGCSGTGGHSEYDEEIRDLVYHECEKCSGTGEQK